MLINTQNNLHTKRLMWSKVNRKEQDTISNKETFTEAFIFQIDMSIWRKDKKKP